MNQGQERFYQFILDRVEEEHKEEAKTLLGESFGKQAGGEFGSEYLAEFKSKMIGFLKTEYVEEVQQIMNNFRG